jgi:3-phosphoshikimate 1-carboxyvinyltransferase
MPLPECIEIEPLRRLTAIEMTAPGSKSLTNRALILAALAHGVTRLRGALWSEDTKAMVDCLDRLGFHVLVEQDPNETANRTLTIRGGGGGMPRGGTPSAPLELPVANAGTAARFLAAMVCLGHGVYRLDGTPRMRERPQAGLFNALRALGYRIDSPNDRLPAVIHAGGPRPGRCRVETSDSSQFASALILSAGRGGWEVEAPEADDEEQPYVLMTRELVRRFPTVGGEWVVEPDASSASYLWAAGWILSRSGVSDASAGPFPVTVKNWPESGWQIDAAFPKFLPLPGVVSRAVDLGDAIMTAMVVAADLEAGAGAGEVVRPVSFSDLRRLRLQECERVAAMRTELSKCGAAVAESGETLTIEPRRLHGAPIHTYDDHRMAMCFATLGLKVPGVAIHNPSCVRKTFPNFFQKLAAPPPSGLGAVIWAVHPKTGARLWEIAWADLLPA